MTRVEDQRSAPEPDAPDSRPLAENTKQDPTLARDGTEVHGGGFGEPKDQIYRNLLYLINVARDSAAPDYAKSPNNVSIVTLISIAIQIRKFFCAYFIPLRTQNGNDQCT